MARRDLLLSTGRFAKQQSPTAQAGTSGGSFTLGEIIMALFPIAKPKAHSLTGRITLPLLQAAFKAVKRNRGAAGIDKVSVKMFEANLVENLLAVERDLKDGSFEPKPLRRYWSTGRKQFRLLDRWTRMRLRAMKFKRKWLTDNL